MDPAKNLFDDLNNYSKLELLISNGDAEGLYLECKAQSSPQLGNDIKAKLAKAVSGFSNTEGGVIIWGISTTRHAHSSLDVLTQLEPIGSCKQYAQQIQKIIPILTTPSITKAQTKFITKKSTDTKGVVITYIPKHTSDPVQSIFNNDGGFYFRSGDEFTQAPYEMVKRLFSATESPDLKVFPHKALLKAGTNKMWEIPIIIENRSSAVAEKVTLSIEIMNPGVCKKIEPGAFHDSSNINPGKKIFFMNISGDSVIHRGLNTSAGAFSVEMLPKKYKFEVMFTIYANKMRAKKFKYCIKLYKSHFDEELLSEDYLY